MRDSFVGPFTIKQMIGKNAVEVILTEEYGRKHPVFPVSLIKHFKETDPDKFPFKTKVKVVIPPFEDTTEPKTISKILKSKMTRVNNKDMRLYLVRYKNRSADEDKWLSEKEIPDNQTLLRKFRAIKRK